MCVFIYICIIFLFYFNNGYNDNNNVLRYFQCFIFKRQVPIICLSYDLWVITYILQNPPKKGKLDELEAGKHPFQEKEPLKEWPEGRNPVTGEQNGPKGPEPTRYGDWERKGRVSDF